MHTKSKVPSSNSGLWMPPEAEAESAPTRNRITFFMGPLQISSRSTVSNQASLHFVEIGSEPALRALYPLLPSFYPLRAIFPQQIALNHRLVIQRHVPSPRELADFAAVGPVPRSSSSEDVR